MAGGHWSRSFGHFRYRERGYLLTIYKYIYIIVADFDSICFSILTNDQMTAPNWFLRQVSGARKKIIFFEETFVDRNERFVPLHCQNEEADRRSLRVKIARVKSRNCAH